MQYWCYHVWQLLLTWIELFISMVPLPAPPWNTCRLLSLIFLLLKIFLTTLVFLAAKNPWKSQFHLQKDWSGRPVLTFGKHPYTIVVYHLHRQTGRSTVSPYGNLVQFWPLSLCHATPGDPLSRRCMTDRERGQNWTNGSQNLKIVNFVPQSRLPYVQICYIYQKTAVKAWYWYQKWLWRRNEYEFSFAIFHPGKQD